MDRFDNIKGYLNSINRNVWLVIGLIVIAGLIAAALTYGDTDELANQTNGNETAQEQPIDGDVNNETPAGSEDDGEDESTDRSEDTNALPAELADTGPAAPLAALSLLGSSGYLYYRSRKQVKQAQQD